MVKASASNDGHFLVVLDDKVGYGIESKNGF